MIGFTLNIAGGLFNLWLYKKYNNEMNLKCAYVCGFASVIFLLAAMV